MKAAVVKAVGEGFVTADLELAEPASREVVVDVQASGLCHTDLTYASTDIGYPVPSVLRHEVFGVVAAVGPEVAELAVCDHVTACLVQPCGRCRKCLTGRACQWEHPEATVRDQTQAPRISLDGQPVSQGFGIGGFAERALSHEAQLVKIPEAMLFPQAALLGCGVVTGAGATLNTAQVQAGDSVVFVGAGGVGLNSISGAELAGATTIVAVDVADDKLEKTREFGATHAVNSTTSDAAAAVPEITGGGADPQSCRFKSSSTSARRSGSRA